MKRFKNLLKQSEFHALLFCFGFALINWPFLGIFDPQHSGRVFVYLFVFWTLGILLLFLVSKSLATPSSPESTRDGGEDHV